MFFLFRIIRRLIAVVLLLVVVVPSYVSYQIWHTGHNAKPVASDAIVVLGAAQFNGVPTPILSARIEDARALYRAGLAPLIITVGAGAKGDNFSEAQSSATTLERGSHVVKAAKVVTISVGRDTLSSTVAYAAYARAHNLRSVIIATDPYHCYRAMAMAHDLGLTASCAPVNAGPGSTGQTGFRYIVRETGAYLAYKSVGRVGIHLSDQVKN
jgi:vancomycin permeability regulator SanA